MKENHSFSTAISVLVIILVLFSTLRFAGADNVNLCWGATHPTEDHNIDNNERAAAAAVCGTITDLYDAYMPSYWWAVDAYGSLTTKSNVLYATDICNQQYDYNSLFWAGDWSYRTINGKEIQEIYIEGNWIPYPVPYDPPRNTIHYSFYDYDDWFIEDDYTMYHPNDFYDGETGYPPLFDSLYDYTTNYNYYFVFLWTCANGNLPPGPGYWDNENHTGAVGMAYAWMHTNDLSTDGYESPDTSTRCYISFEGRSPDLFQVAELVDQSAQVPYEDFVGCIYYIMTSWHESVGTALNWATNAVSGNNLSWFSQTELYNGYTEPNYNECGRMRVFGDGNLVLPYW